MDINNIKLTVQNVGFKGTQTNNRVFLGQPADTFTSSRPSLKEALKTFCDMKNSDGKARFNEEEKKQFAEDYKQNKISVNDLEKFSEIKSVRYQAIKNFPNREKGENNLELDKDVVDIINSKTNVTDFGMSLYEPETQWDIEYKPKENETVKEVYDWATKKVLSKCTLTKSRKGSREVTEDYKNNTTLIKDLYMTETLKDQTFIKRDKDGKTLYVEILKPSEVKGTYNVKRINPDGKDTYPVTASLDKKTGITTIKKDFKSENGTRTQSLYEDDPQGNRLIDYKITNKDGKVLYQDSQTFEVVNDNKFISSRNARQYEITTDKKSLNIKDLALGKEAKIDFKNQVSNEKEEMIKLLKKVPGNELFEAVDAVSNFIGLKKTDELEAGFTPGQKWVGTADNLFIFLHELGHAKDSENRTEKDVYKGNKNYKYSANPEIQKVYTKEKENFLKTHSSTECDYMKYFINAKNHYSGDWGGLSETVAETNAITSSHSTNDECGLGMRAQYLQQHFPETIAAIKKEMEYKNDIEAIEFYGT